MKRFLSVLICFVLAAAFTASAAALAGENYALFSKDAKVAFPINEHIAGDANGDCKVNLFDALAVLRYSVNDFKNTLRDGVDVNSDGKVNPLDVALILHYVVGSKSNLGVLVNGDGTVKTEPLFEESTETAFNITVVSADSTAGTKLSSLKASGEGLFLGWFKDESAALALDGSMAATDGYEGTVYGAMLQASFAFENVDMLASEPYGIRFTSVIDKAIIEALEKVNSRNIGVNGSFTPANEWKKEVGYGTVLMLDLDGTPKKSEGLSVKDGICIPAVYTYASTEDTLSYTATVIGIETAAMADKIEARPYITYVDANSNEHTLYATGGVSSFYNEANLLASDENASEADKGVANSLLSAYKGSNYVSTKENIESFNLSSVKGSADNDNAYVELDRSTYVVLTEDNHSRYQRAFYPRITKVHDSLYFMTFNYNQTGQHIYYTTSTDGINWENPGVFYAGTKEANPLTYTYGSLKGTADAYYGATADHCMLDDGTILCVYSRRACDGYGSNEYTGLHTLELRRGTVNGNKITWSAPMSVYHGHTWEPEIIQRENGNIEIYWSHAAPMIDIYGFDDSMRSSGIAMISSSDNGYTWTPNVTAEDTNHFAGKRIYQYNAGKFTYDNGKTVNFYHGQMPGVVELVDGRMMVVGETRTTSRSYHMISMARSEKNGEWKELGIDEAGPADVVEDMFKGAAPTLSRFDSGELILTYNVDGAMMVKTLNKTGSNGVDARANNTFYSEEGVDSGFWSSSSIVDSHTAILAMSYKKFDGRVPEEVENADGTKTTTLHNSTVVGKVRLNHTINATKRNMIADGNLQEWANINDALFVGSISEVQSTYRFAYDDDYIYIAMNRSDANNNAADANYVMVATKDGYVKAEITAGNVVSGEGVSGGVKTVIGGGKVFEIALDRAALGLTGDYIRVNPGLTDVDAGNVEDRINGTLLGDTSTWIKINLK